MAMAPIKMTNYFMRTAYPRARVQSLSFGPYITWLSTLHQLAVYDNRFKVWVSAFPRLGLLKMWQYALLIVDSFSVCETS